MKNQISDRLRSLSDIVLAHGIEHLNDCGAIEAMTAAADEIDRLSTPGYYTSMDDPEGWSGDTVAEALEVALDFDPDIARNGKPIEAATGHHLPAQWLIALPTRRNPSGEPCEFLPEACDSEEEAAAAYERAVTLIDSPRFTPHLDRFIADCCNAIPTMPGGTSLPDVTKAYRAWIAARGLADHPILDLHGCLTARGWEYARCDDYVFYPGRLVAFTPKAEG